MKFPAEWRSEFLRIYGSSPKSEDFAEFLKRKGIERYIDQDALVARAVNQMAKAFRNTWVDENGICLWGDSRAEDGNMVFGFIPSVEDAGFIHSMLKREQERKEGCEKKIALLSERLDTVQSQMRLPLDEVAATTEEGARTWA